MKHKMKDMKTKDGEVESNDLSNADLDQLQDNQQQYQMHVIENEKASVGSNMGTGSQAETITSKDKTDAPVLQNTALKESTEKYNMQKESGGQVKREGDDQVHDLNQ